VDLTTGVYVMESDPSPPPESKGPPASLSPAETIDAAKGERGTCAPGKMCGVFYPPAKDKALESMKKKTPGLDAR
jgi:hypothetical protein